MFIKSDLGHLPPSGSQQLPHLVAPALVQRKTGFIVPNNRWWLAGKDVVDWDHCWQQRRRTVAGLRQSVVRQLVERVVPEVHGRWAVADSLRVNVSWRISFCLLGGRWPVSGHLLARVLLLVRNNLGVWAKIRLHSSKIGKLGQCKEDPQESIDVPQGSHVSQKCCSLKYS